MLVSLLLLNERAIMRHQFEEMNLMFFFFTHLVCLLLVVLREVIMGKKPSKFFLKNGTIVELHTT